MLIYTGCRIGELLDLKKENVNLEEKYFKIVASKTAAGIRTAPISERFIRSLNTGTTSMIVNISSLLRRVNISNTGIIMIRTGRHLLRPSE